MTGMACTHGFIGQTSARDAPWTCTPRRGASRSPSVKAEVLEPRERVNREEVKVPTAGLHLNLMHIKVANAQLHIYDNNPMADCDATQM